MGDFAVLPNLPDIYRNCKANEDKDMTAFDFVKDHLINIDGIFDKHNHGDEQKPHQPIQRQHHTQPNICVVTHYKRLIIPIYSIELNVVDSNEQIFSTLFTIPVLRPPIV